MHQYYKNNKEIINEKRTCECGCVVCKRSLNRHQQTKKHIELMLQPKRSDIITRQSSGLVDTTVI